MVPTSPGSMRRSYTFDIRVDGHDGPSEFSTYSDFPSIDRSVADAFEQAKQFVSACKKVFTKP
jgi:hypothetical protein